MKLTDTQVREVLGKINIPGHNLQVMFDSRTGYRRHPGHDDKFVVAIFRYLAKITKDNELLETALDKTVTQVSDLNKANINLTVENDKLKAENKRWKGIIEKDPHFKRYCQYCKAPLYGLTDAEADELGEKYCKAMKKLDKEEAEELSFRSRVRKAFKGFCTIKEVKK